MKFDTPMVDKRKALFLDIDGVLNACTPKEDLYYDTYGSSCTVLHRPAVQALKRLLDLDPSLHIVWISDWAQKDRDVDYRFSNDCIANPIDVLESFSWLKNRVAGCACSSKSSRAVAIADWLAHHIVDGYVILDDTDYYSTSGEHQLLQRHFYRVDSAVALTLDNVQSILELARKPLYLSEEVPFLMSLHVHQGFIVNNRYLCRFSFNKYGTAVPPLFEPWQTDSNSNATKSTSVDLFVYDYITHEHLVGMLSLLEHQDLQYEFKHSASLFMKKLDSSNWESNVTVVSISDGFAP